MLSADCYSAEHSAVMPVPIALKKFTRIILPFCGQELLELRITTFHLFTSGEAVVGKVIAAAMLDSQVDQRAEAPGGKFNSLRIVGNMQVEDDAGITVAGPGHEALVVLFDQPHHPVDDVGIFPP